MTDLIQKFKRCDSRYTQFCQTSRHYM